MKRISFKIRLKIIGTFLFCVLSVLVFAVFSYRIHQEIGHRLRLMELAGDLLHDILETRRHEKNFFLFKDPASLTEAITYVTRVEKLSAAHEQEIVRLPRGFDYPEFKKTLQAYQETIIKIEAGKETPNTSMLEESLRNLGHTLVEVSEGWAKEERRQIDLLFQQAMYLFFLSVLVFLVLGISLAFYIARWLVRPLVQMQEAMTKIAHGDFTPLPEPESRAEEFLPLYRAFNRMIQELEDHQEQLVQSRKIAAVGTLTAGVAHELNNPINNIVLTAESLQEDYAQLSQDEAQAMIQDILTQSERASEIVRDLLDFSRSERPEFETISIPAVIHDTLKLVRNQLSLSGSQEELELPADLPLIHGDRKSLQQVFLNLFINAIQAMPQGGTLRIKAGTLEHGPWSPASSPAHHWIKVDVIDSGVGIDSQDLPHVFDPFFTTKDVGRGTGLGLSVSYSIIQKHGGHIEVRSRKGEGTTFTVLLPIEDESESIE
jgi:two-component system, NtrC family, sensor kinase